MKPLSESFKKLLPQYNWQRNPNPTEEPSAMARIGSLECIYYYNIRKLDAIEKNRKITRTFLVDEETHKEIDVVLQDRRDTGWL